MGNVELYRMGSKACNDAGAVKAARNCLADDVLPPTIFSVCMIVCLLQGVGALVPV